MTQSALSSRNFLIYLVGNTISLHGLWIYRVALGWLAWELSESALWVGIIAFTQFAPAVVFGPIFGVLADRFDRRAASLLINSLSLMNMLLLTLLTAAGSVDIYVLTIVSLIQGTLDGAHMPVRMTIVPNLISKGQLSSAIAINSISFNVSRFVGPAIAGIVISTFGVAVAFLVNGLSYLALIAAVLVVRLNPSSEVVPRKKDVWSELRDGIHYVLHHQAIRSLLIVILVGSVFGRGALEMMPAFADAVYGGGSAALATLTSAIGAGAIVTGFALSRGTSWLTIGIIRVAIGLAGLLLSLLGLTDQLWIAVGIVAGLGVMLSLGGVGSQILIQTLVDDNVRGRVSSIWGMIAFGGTALGGLLVGASANVWGLQRAVFATGIACMLAAVIATFRSRRPAEDTSN